jgi:hypothetical protein
VIKRITIQLLKPGIVQTSKVADRAIAHTEARA